MNRNGHISESTARPNRKTPNRSNDSALRERVRVFGSTQTASAIAMMPSGTFIQKISRQPSVGAADEDQQAADRRTERGRDADRRAEEPERAPALLALEQLLDEPEHLRHLDAGRDALQQTRDHQHERTDGEGAEQARHGEQREARR